MQRFHKQVEDKKRFVSSNSGQFLVENHTLLQISRIHRTWDETRMLQKVFFILRFIIRKWRLSATDFVSRLSGVV